MGETQKEQTKPATDTSTALVVRSSSDMAQVEELEQILLGNKEAPEIVDDPEAISREIMMQLLGATSDEELEQVGQAVGWRELQNVPVELHWFRWRPSTFEEGMSVFFVIGAKRVDTGTNVVLTTGSANVLAQLTNMAKRGTLVGAVRAIRQAEKATQGGASGRFPLSLYTPMEAQIEQAKAKAARAAAA